MAKRFFDTEIWKMVWFRKLKPAEKAFYFYLISNCDHAGVYEADIETAEYFIGEKIENPKDFLPDEFTIIEISNNKWFLIDFLKFQYPKGLNSEKPAIVSVRTKLKEYSLSKMVAERFGNDYLMIKDKDKEKDMFKEEEKDKDNDIDIVLVKEEYKEKDKNMFKGKDIIKDKKQDIDSSETFKSYKEGRISLGSTLKQLG